MIRESILQFASADIGTRGPEKYNDWFYNRKGYKYAHCATAVSYWYFWASQHCGVDYPLADVETPEGVKYVPILVNHARKHGKVTTDPQPGDIVCFDWDKNGGADHVGIFEKWADRKAGLFYAIEANTTPDGTYGSQDRGGWQARKLRHTRLVIAFCNYLH
jgi:hypothetical protein